MQLINLNKIVSKLTPLKKKLPKNSIRMLHVTINKLKKLFREEDNPLIRSSLKEQIEKANNKLFNLIDNLDTAKETLPEKKPSKKRSNKIMDKPLLEIHANIKELKREIKYAVSPRIKKLLKQDLRIQVRHLNSLISIPEGITFENINK